MSSAASDLREYHAIPSCLVPSRVSLMSWQLYCYGRYMVHGMHRVRLGSGLMHMRAWEATSRAEATNSQCPACKWARALADALTG